jgi:hypothetical protein
MRKHSEHKKKQRQEENEGRIIQSELQLVESSEQE